MVGCALALRGGGGWMGVEEDGVPELKREAMHSWMCASRTCSPGGISVPQTGHSSSSLTSRRGLGCGGAEGAVGIPGLPSRCVNGGTGGNGALTP
jgi:hypothetical protein